MSPGIFTICICIVMPVSSREALLIRAMPAGLYQRAAPVYVVATTAPPVRVTSRPALTSSLLPAHAVAGLTSAANSTTSQNRRIRGY